MRCLTGSINVHLARYLQVSLTLYGKAPRDADHLAGNECGFLARQKTDSARQVFGIANTPQGGRSHEGFTQLLGTSRTRQEISE